MILDQVQKLKELFELWNFIFVCYNNAHENLDFTLENTLIDLKTGGVA